MRKVSLNPITTLVEGILIGLKNVASLIVAAILYVVTIWIPYINMGTTIAMMTVPGRLAKGQVISPVFIFDGKYRQDFSAFFLLQAFLFIVQLVGYAFCIVPGIIMSISLSLATYILVDFDKSPTDAMKLSNQATYNYKWIIFLINILLGVAIGFLALTFYGIAAIFDSEGLFVFFMIVLATCVLPFELGVNSVIYRKLYLERIEPEAPAAPVSHATVIS